MPFMDPAFAMAICRYDLSGGPIKLTVPVSQAYTSVSFYTRNEVAYYAINDRSAGRKVIELDLMTEAQHNELPEDEEVTAADRLIIDSPTATGLIVLKALAPEPGLMPQAQASLAASSCAVQTDAPPPPKQPEPSPTPARRRPGARSPSAHPVARMTGKVIEHRHPPDIGGRRDLVHRHMIEAPLQEEARGGVGDALPRGEALTGSTVGWHVDMVWYHLA